MQYLFVKYSHQIFVAITILLFNIRFFLLWRHPEKPLSG
ncbi:SirB2 family protein, partial [Neisseria sp. P0021.S007]